MPGTHKLKREIYLSLQFAGVSVHSQLSPRQGGTAKGHRRGGTALGRAGRKYRDTKGGAGEILIQAPLPQGPFLNRFLLANQPETSII